ncbi:MAG: ribokinase [Anaerolineae bacterium]|nr:ribokinase [Anaerolineae bacterium]
MTRALSPVDYLAVGHVTRDVLPGGRYAVGGTASYAALTAAALGRVVGVLTSAGPDADFSAFAGRVSVSCHPAPATTTFENLYFDGLRRQFVYSQAATLSPDLIPASWQRAPLVHLGPVMGECDPAMAAFFASHAFVGMTPQGWMRTLDTKGQVLSQFWPQAAQLLPQASAVVFSIEDIGGNWALARHYAQQTHILVITCGRRGGMLFVDGVETRFPAIDVTEVDPTGAGDVFAAAFFIALVLRADPLSAANYAACLAGHSVTRRGLAAIPTPDDVAACPLSVLDHSNLG